MYSSVKAIVEEQELKGTYFGYAQSGSQCRWRVGTRCRLTAPKLQSKRVHRESPPMVRRTAPGQHFLGKRRVPSAAVETLTLTTTWITSNAYLISSPQQFVPNTPARCKPEPAIQHSMQYNIVQVITPPIFNCTNQTQRHASTTSTCHQSLGNP
jgi:hypothetical protein